MTTPHPPSSHNPGPHGPPGQQQPPLQHPGGQHHHAIPERPLPHLYPHLDIGATEILSRGFKAVWANLGAVYGYGLLLSILWVAFFVVLGSGLYADLIEDFAQQGPAVMSQLAEMQDEPPPVMIDLIYEFMLRNLIVSLLGTLLAGVLLAGISAFFLQRGRGLHAGLGTLFHGFRALGPLLVGSFILHVLFNLPGEAIQLMTFADGGANLANVGLALLSNLALLWLLLGMALFFPWALATLDQGYGATESLRRWWELSYGFRTKIFVSYLLWFLIGGIGGLIALFVVGLIALMIGMAAPMAGIVFFLVAAYLVYMPLAAMGPAMAAAAYDAIARFHTSLGTGLVNEGLYPDPYAAFGHAQAAGYGELPPQGYGYGAHDAQGYGPYGFTPGAPGAYPHGQGHDYPYPQGGAGYPGGVAPGGYVAPYPGGGAQGYDAPGQPPPGGVGNPPPQAEASEPEHAQDWPPQSPAGQEQLEAPDDDGPPEQDPNRPSSNDPWEAR